MPLRHRTFFPVPYMSRQSHPRQLRGMRFFLSKREMMEIKINGETKETQQNTVSGLLHELGITPGTVAVELNLKIISKADHNSTSLSEGDILEVVNFVGGG